MKGREVLFRGVVTAVFAVAAPAAATAQDGFAESCAGESTFAREFCERVGQALGITQPRLGISLTGGNPVPGTASTLGMRLGTMPRFSLAARATATYTEIPDVRESDGEAVKFPLGSVNADASVGLFSGLSFGPTVGGFGSLDVLGSVGFIPLPDGEGFSEGSPVTWAAGARLGLLRESFTAPGISVSGMYRSLGDVAYGDSTLQTSDGFFAVDNYTVMSFRAAISKRIPLIGLGATAGVGYDRYNSAARIAGTVPAPGGDGRFDVTLQDLETDRRSAFVNASWTLMLLSIVGEVGWQEGGEARSADPVLAEMSEKDGYFGSVALRITL